MKHSFRRFFDRVHCNMSSPPQFEIRPSPIHGLGLFALRDFQPDELIFREPIALHVSKSHRVPNGPANPREIYAAFKAAPKYVQESLMQLTESPHPAPRSAITGHLYGPQWLFPEYATAFRVAAKFNNNAFGDSGANWVALNTSRINHSCTVPNARARREGGQEMVFATTAIKEGEEVLMNYLGSGHRGVVRRAYLKLWGIRGCACELCSPADEEEGAVGESGGESQFYVHGWRACECAEEDDEKW